MYLWPFIFTARAITSILDDFFLLRLCCSRRRRDKEKVFNTFLYLHVRILIQVIFHFLLSYFSPPPRRERERALT